jgi:outer membrane protein OmpA-like peptidoglycan-associated protein
VFRDAGRAVLLLALLAPAFAHAQSLADDISAALRPPPRLTRSVGLAAPDPKAAADKQFVDELRSRSIAIEPVAPPTAAEREQVYAIASSRPAIDLEILFESGSALIGGKTAPALAALGQALSRPEFKGEVFFINGYTDAKGSAAVNQLLSQRRAEAVRRALIAQFRLPPDTLIAVGFGKERLKNPAHPLTAENRRVQIVNTTVTAAR